MSIFSIFSSKTDPVALPFNTDIHCHVLPGVDDGSPDVETSVELIRHMHSWGINRIIASPHITEATFENTPEILDPALDELNDALKEAGINIPVTRASENRLDDYFREQLEAGQIKPLPGNYILVENSFIQEPWHLDEQLFDLKMKGYRPIMAHPERFFYYHDKKLSRYMELHRAGNLFQVNLLSLAGAYSKVEKKIAEQLVEGGMVDFVGTDIHNMRHIEVIESYLRTRDAQKYLGLLQGKLRNDSIPAE